MNPRWRSAGSMNCGLFRALPELHPFTHGERCRTLSRRTGATALKKSRNSSTRATQALPSGDTNPNCHFVSLKEPHRFQSGSAFELPNGSKGKSSFSHAIQHGPLPAITKPSVPHSMQGILEPIFERVVAVTVPHAMHRNEILNCPTGATSFWHCQQFQFSSYGMYA